MRVELQPAYILHARPYRDTSLLVDCLTADYGRLTLVAKGVRQAKSKQKQLLQPFIPLSLSWQGKSSLKTMIAIEAEGNACHLSGHYLYSGFYANELLTYLCREGDPVTDIYDSYQLLLNALVAQKPLAISLRQFEFSLLIHLGYGIDFFHEAENGESIYPDKYYQFIADAGFIEAPSNSKKRCYSGLELLAIANNDYSQDKVCQAAKYIAREALHVHLAGREIKSRRLFV